MVDVFKILFLNSSKPVPEDDTEVVMVLITKYVLHTRHKIKRSLSKNIQLVFLLS